jgi:T5SS/PEP-CTERM-associated repeat protein
MFRSARLRFHKIALLLVGLICLHGLSTAQAITLNFFDGSSSSTNYDTSYDGSTNSVELQVLSGSATYNGSITGTGLLKKTGAGYLLMTGTYSNQNSTMAIGGAMDLTGRVTQTFAVPIGNTDGSAAELRLRLGGFINSGNVFLEAFTGSGPASATVDGATTLWTATGLYLGYASSGSFTISSGRQVQNTFVHIGEQAGTTGTVLVTGSGSTLAASGAMNVGYGGTGALTIPSGGN